MLKIKLQLLPEIALTLIFLSCSNEVKQKGNPEKPNQVVLIFEGMPDNSRYYWKAGHFSQLSPPHEICYIDDSSIIRHFNPANAPGKDTLLLSSTRDVIEVQHTYKGTDHLSYRFQNGDSVLFTYQGKKPFAKILNRQVNDVEVNYSIRKRKKLSNDYFPGLMRINRSFALTQEFDSIPWERKAEVAKQVGIKAALEEFESEGEWLDSLYQNNLLSEQAYYFYYTKRNMDMANAGFDTDFGFDLDGVDGIREVLSPQQMLTLNFDTASTRFYYHKMLEEKRREFFLSKVDLLRHSNGSYRDSRQAYDLIRKSTRLSDQEKDLMLVKTMGEIYNNFDLEDRLEYWEKFGEDISDPVYFNLIAERYNFGKPIKDEVELIGLLGETTTLAKALEEYKGKVVYLDFWASWCAPCISLIPDAKELQRAYEGSDVVFMYISIDEVADQWEKASLKYSLNRNFPGYRILNRKRSRHLDYLNVTRIPRYLIYDRTGKLVEGDAPRPGTREVRNLLNRYLKEEIR